MAGNREAAMRVGVRWLKKLDPSGVSAKTWQEMCDALSDKEFEAYIESLEKEEGFVPLIYENMTGSAITTDLLMNVAKEMGVELFQKVVTTDPVTGLVHKAPHKRPVLTLPVRRPVQMLREKWHIPKDSFHRNELTGQVTGHSKGNSLTLPETLILNAQGFDKSLEEFLHLRGGDPDAEAMMEAQILQTGECDATEIKQMGTKTKATHSLSVFLRGQHFDNTL